MCRDYEIKSYKIQFIFALIFMFAVNMQELVIFEIIKVMSPKTRRLLWLIDLVALIFMLLCLVPMYFFYTLVQYKRWRAEVKLFVILSLEGLYIFLFSRMDESLTFLQRNGDLFSIEYGISRYKRIYFYCG